MRGGLSILRFGAWLGISMLTLYLVFIGGGWLGLYATEVRALSVGVTGLVIAAWAIAAVRRPHWLPRSTLMPAFLVALAAFAIGVALSRQPRLGIEYLGFAVLLTALYLLLVRILADPWFRTRFMGIVVVVALVHGVAYLWETLGTWFTWWELVGRFTTPPLRPRFGSLMLGNPSAVMTVQVLLTVAGVAWIGWGTARRRLLSGSLLSLAAAATLISGSRSGWLALAAAVAVIVLVWLASPDRRAWLASRLRSRAGRAGLAAVGVAVAVSVVALAPGLLLRAGAGGETYRLANFAAAWRMFVDHPVHGIGPGNWVAQRIAYTVPPEPDYYIPYAHNLPLQTLAEFGLLGALAGVIVLALLARLIWQGIRDPDPVRRRMGWAALLGTLYFAAHQMLDFYGSSPTALFAYAIAVAFLDGSRPGAAHPPRVRTGSRALAVVGSIAVGLAVAGLLLAEQVAATMAHAVRLADQGRWAEAMPIAQTAAGQDPGMPAYQFALATIADHARHPDVAAEAWQRSASMDDLPVAWIGVAAASTAVGHSDQAHAALERALRVGYQQPAVLVAAGDIYLRLGDDERAIDCFAQAIVAAPSLAGDPRWIDDGRLAHIHQPVIERARRQMPATSGIDLALSLGDVRAAERLLPTLPDSDREAWSRLIEAWQGDRMAAAELRARAEAAPLSLPDVLLAARAAAQAGDRESAEDLRRWADIVNGNSSVASYRVRFAASDLPPNRVAGLAGHFYGHYTYRRPTPTDQIPASLLHLQLE